MEMIRQIFSLFKKDSLEKGGAMSKFPVKLTSVGPKPPGLKNNLSEWQQEGNPHARENLPAITGNERVRALHKLSGATQTRLGPDGKRQFLLHRGMSRNERLKSVGENSVNHDIKSSWTPRPDIANDFRQNYNNGSGGDADENDYKDYQGDHKPMRPDIAKHRATSAWVHEDAIHSIPRQYGHNDEKRKNLYAGEHEVIVRPGHNSQRAADLPIDTDLNINSVNDRINYKADQASEKKTFKRAPSQSMRDLRMFMKNKKIGFYRNR